MIASNYFDADPYGHLGYYTWDPNTAGVTLQGIDWVGSIAITQWPKTTALTGPNGGFSVIEYAGYYGHFGGSMKIQAPVPEPTSLALMGLGVAGVAAVRRRKRKTT